MGPNDRLLHDYARDEHVPCIKVKPKSFQNIERIKENRGVVFNQVDELYNRILKYLKIYSSSHQSATRQKIDVLTLWINLNKNKVGIYKDRNYLQQNCITNK